MKTLLVEDDRTTLLMLRDVLQAAGYEVTSCEDAESAWEAFRAIQHDILVVDWVLPGMDGVALCKLVRSCPGGDLPLILVITGRGNQQYLQTFLESGADDFLAKPIDGDLLKVRLTIATKRVRNRIRQKEVEQELVESEKRYRRLTGAVTDYIFTVRIENGRPTSTSHSGACKTVTGYSPAEFDASPYLWIEMVHDEDRDAVRQQAEDILSGKDPRPLEHRIIRKDGQMRWVCNTLVPQHNARGELISYDGLIQDITPRRRAEEEQRLLEAHIQRAQRLESLGVLAGGIAHDFNNILGAILGYTGLAIDEVAESSIVRANLDQVMKAVARARELVQQILAFSRHTEQERAPVAMSAVVTEALKLLRPSVPTTIEFRQHITQAPSIVHADATQIHRMIVNLCANAAHAMRDRGGVLTLEVDIAQVTKTTFPSEVKIEPGEYVRLVVSDTGHGMPPGVRERIFEPFFTTKSVGEGTGMGLAVVHGIVTSHGGHITVESETGKGAKFQVFLPRVAGAAETAVVPAEVPDATGKEHVLFVDDEETLARLGVQILERQGYRVTAATDSTKALAMFQEDPARFDVVVTDQTMPGLTGDALARELTRIRPGIPIILTTGYVQRFTDEAARAIGVCQILTKPVPGQDLAQAIRQALDKTSKAS